MATYEQVMTALRNADAEGAEDDARRLAEIARSMKQSETTETNVPRETSSAVNPTKSAVSEYARKPMDRPGETSTSAGLRSGITSLVGMPVDVAENLLNLGIAGYGSAATALGKPELAPEVLSGSYGGTKNIKGLLGRVGLGTENPNPENVADRLAYKTAELTGMSLFPGGLLPKVGTKLTAAQTIPQIPLASTLAMAGGGAVAGEVLGEEYAPLGMMFPAAATVGANQLGKTAIGTKIAEVKNLLKPGGYRDIAENYLNRIVGKGEKAGVVEGLTSAKPILEGSRPNVDEAVSGLPGGSPLQAHQAIVAQEPGGISAKFGKRLAQQGVAREKALSFAGTEESLQKAIAERTAAVEPLYAAVEQSTAKVNAFPVLKNIDGILQKNSNRTSVVTPLIQIKHAIIDKTPTGFGLENNPQRLKSLSDNISDMMGKKTPGGQYEFDVKVLKGIKDTLDKQIGLAEPKYREALRVFQEKSIPINKMEIGQRLKSKLVSPTGVETPGTYLRAIDDERKLIKESTGFARGKLEHILSSDEIASVQNVAKDLERKLAAIKPLQKTNLRGGVNVANETTLSLPNLLYTPATLANYVLKSVGRDIEPNVDRYLAYLYRNPKAMAKVLSKIPEDQRTVFYAIAKKSAVPMTVNSLNMDNQGNE